MSAVCRAMRISRLFLSWIFPIALLGFFSSRSEAATNASPPRAHLQLVVYDGAVLERNDHGIWRVICDRACERDLDVEADVAHAEYRIHDSKGYKSPPFRIRAAAGDHVVLIAHPPSLVQRNVGVVTALLGGVASVAMTVALVDATANCHDDDGGFGCPSFVPLAIATGISLLVTAAGITLAATDDPSASQSLVEEVSSPFVHEQAVERSPAPDFLTARRSRANSPWTMPLLIIHF